MFIKLGNAHNINLLVKDINGNAITNDTPYCTIKNVQTQEYFNGIGFQIGVFNIIMPHIGNGVYSYSFTPSEIGIYEIKSTSENFSVIKTESLDVYDTDVLTYGWLTGAPFAVNFSGNETDNVYVKITKSKDGTRWDGTQWSDSESPILMTHVDAGVFEYTFTPDEESEYNIVSYTDTSEQLFVLNVSDTGDNTSPVSVTSETLRSLDGSSSVLTDDSNNPLKDVKITVYNSDKNIVGVTYTNSLGEWDLMLKPNNYYFMFELVGYVSVGFERMVV